MKNIRKLLIVSSTCLALCSCGITTTSEASSTSPSIESSSSSTSETPVTKTEIIPNSLQEGLNLLFTTKNYSIDYVVNNEIEKTYVFTENSIGIYSETDVENNDFYIVSGKGLYEVNFLNEYVSGEYIVDDNGKYITDLWNNNVIGNLFGININDVMADKSVDSLMVKNRDVKSKFIKAVGYSSDTYLNIESLKASYQNKEIRFDLKFFDEKVSRIYKANSFGITENAIADEMVKNNTPGHEFGYDLTTMRRLIKGDNFHLESYDIVEDYVYAEEWFHKDYWFTTQMNYGYFGAKHKATGVGEDTVDIVGSYMFQYIDGKIQLNSTMFSTMTDITEYLHYPSRSALFDRMQYIKSGVYKADVTGFNMNDHYIFKGNPYYVDDLDYVLDMARLYNLAPDNSSEGSIFQKGTPKALLIDVKASDKYGDPLDDSKCEVTFVYVFEFSKKEYYMPLHMYGFGKVSFPNLDTYLAEFNNF